MADSGTSARFRSYYGIYTDTNLPAIYFVSSSYVFVPAKSGGHKEGIALQSIMEDPEFQKSLCVRTKYGSSRETERIKQHPTDARPGHS